MKAVLTTIVVILLATTIATSTFVVKLYGQRESLLLQSKKLASAIVTMASTFEDEYPELDNPPEYPARDIKHTTAEQIEEPERSLFWEEYDHTLELDPSSTLNIVPRYKEFFCLYRLDPIEGKPLRDSEGNKITKGPGTLQNLLDDVIMGAEKHLGHLESTRDSLKTTRHELVTTIKELNKKKQNLRTALKEVNDKDTVIAELNETLDDKSELIAQHEQSIEELNISLDEKDTQIAIHEETIDEQEREIAWLEKERTLRNGKTPATVWSTLPLGRKGEVASVNREWEIVTVNLTDDFIECYATALESGREPPTPEFRIVRKDQDSETFVGKIQLAEVDTETKLGVANILADWQQQVFQKGDKVVY